MRTASIICPPNVDLVSVVVFSLRLYIPIFMSYIILCMIFTYTVYLLPNVVMCIMAYYISTLVWWDQGFP